MLVVYKEVVTEPNYMSDRMKAYLDDPQWPKHSKDLLHKKIKRRTSSNLEYYLELFYLTMVVLEFGLEIF